MQTSEDFQENLEGRLRAQRDYACYLASKGIYMEQGNYCHWEPTDWTDLEPLEPNYAPGATRRGELDDFDNSDCEEF